MLQSESTGARPQDAGSTALETALRLSTTSGHEERRRGEGHRARIPALDFTKGLLVLVMVLYHWMNYFVDASGEVYKYLRFLTPSYIFITGFLVSQIYTRQRGSVHHANLGRLYVRGIKLLAITLLLNLGSLISGPGTPKLNTSATPIWKYLTGITSPAFSVLLPIAYLLILSAFLLTLSRGDGKVLQSCSTALVTLAGLCAWFGLNTGYLQIFSMGMVGSTIGVIGMDRLDWVLSATKALLTVYAAYLTALTVFGDSYGVQVLGVTITLALMYRIGQAGNPNAFVFRLVTMLGRYSLFGYIAQIFLLQVCRRLEGRLEPLSLRIGVLLACTAATILLTELLDYGKRRWTPLSRAYNAVFS